MLATIVTLQLVKWSLLISTVWSKVDWNWTNTIPSSSAHHQGHHLSQEDYPSMLMTETMNSSSTIPMIPYLAMLEFQVT